MATAAGFGSRPPRCSILQGGIAILPVRHVLLEALMR